MVGTGVEMNLVVFVKTEELDQKHEAVHARAQDYYCIVNGGMHTLELEDASKRVVGVSVDQVSTWSIVLEIQGRNCRMLPLAFPPVVS